MLALAALGALAAPAPTVAATPGKTGTLVILAVDADTYASVAGLEVRVAGVPAAITGAEGLLRLELPAGEHRLSLGELEHTIPILSGHETEVIVRVQHGAVVELTMEAADTSSTSVPGRDEPALAGRILGRVVDAERGVPIAGARVIVRGQEAEARTGAGGHFALDLPAGPQTLTIIHPRYATTSTRTEAGAEPLEQTFSLLPAMAELDAVVVLAPRISGATASLLEERRRSAGIDDFVGAEAMAKSGDSDAAGALGRVTGITVVGGRFVYVRGLGERYSSTLLDDSSLPSPEPTGRAVPLDMFPAGMLESVRIEKGYSVDRPGEFGGGTVVLRTRAPPRRLTTELGLSIGGVGGTTLEMGLGHAGGGLDWLGFGAGARALPDEVDAASRNAPLREGDMFSTRGYTPEQLERYGEAMSARGYGTSEQRAMPDLGLSASIGGPFTVVGGEGGLSLGLVYKNEWDCCGRHTEDFGNEVYDYRELENEITLGGLMTGALDLGDHRLRYTGVLSRISDARTTLQEGYDVEIAGHKRVLELQWEERMLTTHQLRAVHPTGQGVELRWRYMLSLATLDDPDRRQLRYDLEAASGTYRLSSRPEGNLRVFTELDDLGHDLGLAAVLPLGGTQAAPRELEVGLDGGLKTRAVSSRRFKLKSKGALAAQAMSLPPESIFTADTIGPGGFQLDELSRPSDSYEGRQILGGLYAQTRYALTEQLSVLAGIRLEHSSQQIETFNPFNPDFVPETAALTATDLLPAATLSLYLSDQMVLRAGASRTVSRPNFREISPARVKELAGQYEVQGNTSLGRAQITHLDTRWEWYFAAGESLSFGAFAKLFDDPIEQRVVPGADRVLTFGNAGGATAIGFEAEAKKTLGFFGAALSDFYLAGNVTLVRSRVELPAGGIETSRARPLQGQSPYVINLQGGYDDPDGGTSFAILLNVFGPRIERVGAETIPDRYEEAFAQLDAVWIQDLGQGFKLTLKGKNLLDPEVLYTEGDRRAVVYHKGRSLTLGLAAKL